MYIILCMHCSLLCTNARKTNILSSRNHLHLLPKPISLLLFSFLHFLSLCVHMTDSVWLLRVASKRTLEKIYVKQVAENGNKVFYASDAESLMLLLPLLSSTLWLLLLSYSLLSLLLFMSLSSCHNGNGFY